MSWTLAIKLALQSLFDKKTRNFIIGLVLFIILGLLVVVTLPTMLLSFPRMAFTSEEESNQMESEYTDILVEYKQKIHTDIKNAKSNYTSQGKKISRMKLNYPSLSLVIAYESVINKEKMLGEESEVLKLSKEEIFQFLDTTMSYEVENEDLIAKVKSADEIANYFTSEEDKNMFKLVYETMRKTDLDNTVPDVEFKDFDYLEGGINLPYFSQRDQRWAYSPYGLETIQQAGCGIVSMTMVLNGLKPELNILPPELARWSYENGHYVDNVGTAWSLFGALANEYGLTMKNLSRNNPQTILDELAKGNPVVMSLDPGSFINGYHIIVLRGVTSDGKILVSDPWSIENSKKAWDFGLLLAESSSLSPSCFWAFSK